MNGFVRCLLYTSSIVQQGLGSPLLAPADLHDGLLDGTDQRLVLAAFRPEDLLFNHRHIDHMEVVVVETCLLYTSRCV